MLFKIHGIQIQVIILLLIILQTGIQHYKIFSAYKIPAETYYTTTYFANDAAFLDFKKEMQARSVYDYGVELRADLPILTLSTCGATSAHRVVIHAQLIEE